MGTGGYWNGPQSRLHFHISANEGAWGMTDARLFAHVATRPRSLLLDFYLSPLRET